MNKNFFILISFLSFLIFISNLFSQQSSNEEILKGFDEYVVKVMSDWKVQGSAVAVVKNGKLIYSKGYGLRDVKNNLPVTVNTLFAIGVLFKSIYCRYFMYSC
jgi:CubicO group peptidase (beta-lactamase class C family)